MNDFTASNGIELRIAADLSGQKYLSGTVPNEHGPVGFTPTLHATASEEGMAALREFFQAEADERLGRFRADATTAYVVYPRRNLNGSINHCFVVHETTGHGTDFDRGVKDEGKSYPYQRAARAYFDAHPEPKPWHEAQPGEVWLLSVNDRESAVVTVARDTGHLRFFEVSDSDEEPMTWGWRGASITAGRRIWPEVAS